jgi:hypothetical protein
MSDGGAAKLLSPSYEYLELMPEEYVNLRDVHSVSTLTFYHGSPPVEWLEKRIREIVCLNPWLDSRSVSKGKAVVIKYRNDSENMDSFPDSLARGGRTLTVVEATENPITEEACRTYDFCPHVDKYLVRKGGECVDQDVPLFHVAVFKCSDSKFALLVSISHTLVDGFTYYSLYGMLSRDVAPRALIARREVSFRDSILPLTEANNEFFTSAGFICNIIGHVFCHTKPTLQHRLVSSEFVAKQKRLQLDLDGTAISTNDIVTSNLFVHSNCDVGFMAVNFRGRIAAATVSHAGNYEGTVRYLRPDFETPRLIRQSIGAPVQGGQHSGFDINTSFRPVVTGSATFSPGFFERRKLRVGIITNWCSFYSPIVFEGCSQTLHIPILENVVATGLVVGIMYMALPGKVAIAMFQPENNSMTQNMEAIGLLTNMNM